MIMMIMRISYIILYRTSHPLATPHYRQAIPHDLSAKKKKEKRRKQSENDERPRMSRINPPLLLKSHLEASGIMVGK